MKRRTKYLGINGNMYLGEDVPDKSDNIMWKIEIGVCAFAFICVIAETIATIVRGF